VGAAGRTRRQGRNDSQAAKRELREETGHSAKKWTKLASFYASPGFLAEKMTIFLAQELTEGEQEPMEDERIELEWFPPQKLDKLIGAGKIQDAKTMIGFLTWKRYASRTAAGKRSK
jgi:ADP-ribose pyrophosphatase